MTCIVKSKEVVLGDDGDGNGCGLRWTQSYTNVIFDSQTCVISFSNRHDENVLGSVQINFRKIITEVRQECDEKLQKSQQENDIKISDTKQECESKLVNIKKEFDVVSDSQGKAIGDMTRAFHEIYGKFAALERQLDGVQEDFNEFKSYMCTGKERECEELIGRIRDQKGEVAGNDNEL